MNNPLDNDFLQSWTAAQQRLWQELSNNLSVFQPPATPPGLQGIFPHVAALESVVEQALAVQKAWLEEWAAGVINRPDAPEPVTEWARQVEEVMKSWLDLQIRIWRQWFALLKQSDPDVSQAAKSNPVTAAAAPPATSAAAESAAQPSVVVNIGSATPGKESEKDDLKLIKGIGTQVEQRLNERGIHSFRQIAELEQLDEAALQKLETEVIRFAGRIARDNWIGQAKEQHFRKYQEPL